MPVKIIPFFLACLENQEFNMEKSIEEKITGAGDMFVVQECGEDNIHPFFKVPYISTDLVLFGS